MKKKKKKKIKVVPVIILIVVALLAVIVVWNSFFKTNPTVVTVVSRIDSYQYYLDSNETRVYKKYYKELENQLKDNKIDEKEYAETIAKLFTIDFYTLNNKITNQDIGGIQFVHSALQEKFKIEASSSVYQYVKNNISGTRKQKLPEVKTVETKSVDQIKYNQKDYQDESAYRVVLNIEYVKDLEYPKEIKLTFIHEDNKLSLVEIK